MPDKNASVTAVGGRKARITGVEKYVKKYSRKFLSEYGLPFVRYSIVPGIYSIVP